MDPRLPLLGRVVLAEMEGVERPELAVPTGLDIGGVFGDDTGEELVASPAVVAVLRDRCLLIILI